MSSLCDFSFFLFANCENVPEKLTTWTHRQGCHTQSWNSDAARGVYQGWDCWDRRRRKWRWNHLQLHPSSTVICLFCSLQSASATIVQNLSAWRLCWHPMQRPKKNLIWCPIFSSFFCLHFFTWGVILLLYKSRRSWSWGWWEEWAIAENTRREYTDISGQRRS
jgi:hypothetical protein